MPQMILEKWRNKMRKPSIKKEVIPIKSQSVVKASPQNAGSITNILSKLEPQQLFDLVDKLTNLSQSYFEYGIEREKTKQTAIHATIRIQEIEAGLETAHLEHEQIMAQIQLDNRKDKRQFKKDMRILENESDKLDKKDKYIHRILDLLESKVISETALINLLNDKY